MEYPTAYLMLRVLLPTAYKAAFENSYSKDADQLFSNTGFQETRRELELLDGFLDQNLIFVFLSQDILSKQLHIPSSAWYDWLNREKNTYSVTQSWECSCSFVVQEKESLVCNLLLLWLHPLKGQSHIQNSHPCFCSCQQLHTTQWHMGRSSLGPRPSLELVSYKCHVTLPASFSLLQSWPLCSYKKKSRTMGRESRR